ncbi:MAG: hypothetical protein HY287_05450 [Planctomycetes bacterium]|nr:hypothetical protein [Planctomycetota bacterium]MBI3833756.1 hypothetical protein [Planctomycetota bacterium]
MRGGQPCDQCKGSGSGGMGTNMARGRGGVAQTEQTDTSFKTEHGKVQTTKGAIVGQFLVDGEQVRGETSKPLAEAVTAAERDASDLIYRDRIPRQYHKAIKNYFSTMQKSLGSKAKPDGVESSKSSTKEGAANGAQPTKP